MKLARLELDNPFFFLWKHYWSKIIKLLTAKKLGNVINFREAGKIFKVLKKLSINVLKRRK